MARGCIALRAGLVLGAFAGCDRVLGLEPPLEGDDPDDASRSDAVLAGCPFGASTYAFFDSPLVSWSQAEAHCQGLDAIPDDDTYVHLAVVADMLEARLLPDREFAWVGLRLQPDTVWRWVTDEPVPAPPWEIGKPQGGTCATIDKGKDLLDDSDCDAMKQIICECDTWPVVR